MSKKVIRLLPSIPYRDTDIEGLLVPASVYLHYWLLICHAVLQNQSEIGLISSCTQCQNQ